MRANAALLIALLFALLAPDAARAEGRISGLNVTVDGGRVLASLTLVDGFRHRLRERVDSGLPTSIVYRFELDEDRTRWWDRYVEECTLEVTAMYDAVARHYTVNYKLDGKLIDSRTVHDQQALAAAMTRVESLPVFTLASLPRRGRLLVKARAELGSRTALSIVPVAITTDWVESAKFRAPAPLLRPPP
jgi:hypothetical protein